MGIAFNSDIAFNSEFNSDMEFYSGMAFNNEFNSGKVFNSDIVVNSEFNASWFKFILGSVLMVKLQHLQPQ